MEFIAGLKPLLWQILEKKKEYAINVSSLDNELTISILFGKKLKRFKNKNNNILLSEIKQYFKFA